MENYVNLLNFRNKFKVCKDEHQKKQVYGNFTGGDYHRFKKGYSHIGNDGIIDYIFEKIKIKKGTFVEFGAYDGIYQSNSRKLFENGWEGIFIETDKERCRNLKNNYREHKNIICLNKEVGVEKNQLFDNIVDPYLKDKKIDFCSIDVDGIDVEIFETFKKYSPTVVCIESGFVLPVYHERVPISVSCKCIQQSLSETIKVFEKRGYKILSFCQDCFFIKKEFYHLFNVSSDILTLYFNGLRALPQIIPHFKRYCKGAKIKNEVAEYILKRSKYNQYKLKYFKKWAHKESKRINKFINKAEQIERKKHNKQDKA